MFLEDVQGLVEDNSTNRQTAQKSINCCDSTYILTICTLCKVYLAQSMDFTGTDFCLHHG